MDKAVNQKGILLGPPEALSFSEFIIYMGGSTCRGRLQGEAREDSNDRVILNLP